MIVFKCRITAANFKCWGLWASSLYAVEKLIQGVILNIVT